jgi:hypothetical protein
VGRLERVPGVQNWIEKLPSALRREWDRSIIYRAATHMVETGRIKEVGHAIASAINWAQHIVDTDDVKQWKGPQHVKPTSVAECAAALALWQTMKAWARSH